MASLYCTLGLVLLSALGWRRGGRLQGELGWTFLLTSVETVLVG